MCIRSRSAVSDIGLLYQRTDLCVYGAGQLSVT